MGWMPIPIDSAIWNSIWVQEHARTHHRPSDLRATILDFRLGYTLAAVVAVLFLSLGALVMRGRVTELADGAGFIQQLIGTYAETLGRWSIPVIGIAALTTMLSTTLVVLDAFPRGPPPISYQTKICRCCWGVSPPYSGCESKKSFISDQFLLGRGR